MPEDPPPPPQLSAAETAAAAALAKCVLVPPLHLKSLALSNGGDDRQGGAHVLSETKLLREVEDEREPGCVM